MTILRNGYMKVVTVEMRDRAARGNWESPQHEENAVD